MGTGRDGTIEPPDDSNRDRRRGRGRLRLVADRSGRESLPPESAAFDPELDAVDVELEHRRKHRRVLRLGGRDGTGWRSDVDRRPRVGRLGFARLGARWRSWLGRLLVPLRLVRRPRLPALCAVWRSGASVLARWPLVLGAVVTVAVVVVAFGIFARSLWAGHRSSPIATRDHHSDVRVTATQRDAAVEPGRPWIERPSTRAVEVRNRHASRVTHRREAADRTARHHAPVRATATQTVTVSAPASTTPASESATAASAPAAPLTNPVESSGGSAPSASNGSAASSGAGHSGGGSSSLPAGPTGPGSAQGCDPKCGS